MFTPAPCPPVRLPRCAAAPGRRPATPGARPAAAWRRPACPPARGSAQRPPRPRSHSRLLPALQRTQPPRSVPRAPSCPARRRLVSRCLLRHPHARQQLRQCPLQDQQAVSSQLQSRGPHERCARQPGSDLLPQRLGSLWSRQRRGRHQPPPARLQRPLRCSLPRPHSRLPLPRQPGRRPPRLAGQARGSRGPVRCAPGQEVRRGRQKRRACPQRPAQRGGGAAPPRAPPRSPGRAVRRPSEHHLRGMPALSRTVKSRVCMHGARARTVHIITTAREIRRVQSPQ